MKKRKKQPDRQERREDAPTHTLGRGKAADANVAGRRRRAGLPKRFVPQFWVDVDKRYASVREIKRRLDLLKADTGADSYPKDLLCQRAVFVSLQLETMECQAAEAGGFDAGRYTQMLNTLLGLLKTLGLERKVKAVGLKAYVRNVG